MEAVKSDDVARSRRGRAVMAAALLGVASTVVGKNDGGELEVLESDWVSSMPSGVAMEGWFSFGRRPTFKRQRKTSARNATDQSTAEIRTKRILPRSKNPVQVTTTPPTESKKEEVNALPPLEILEYDCSPTVYWDRRNMVDTVEVDSTVTQSSVSTVKPNELLEELKEKYSHLFKNGVLQKISDAAIIENKDMKLYIFPTEDGGISLKVFSNPIPDSMLKELELEEMTFVRNAERQQVLISKLNLPPCKK